jgi:hypothetical protein
MSDSEESQLEAAYEKLSESSSSTVVADPKKKKAHVVVKWPRITQVKVNADGKTIYTHPFLSDDNVYDKLDITHLVVDKPFLAGYGAVAQAWKNSGANMIKDLEIDSGDDDSGPLTYPAITAKSIKIRFDAYMKSTAFKKRTLHLTVVATMKRYHAICSSLLRKCSKSTPCSWKPKTVTSRALHA